MTTFKHGIGIKSAQISNLSYLISNLLLIILVLLVHGGVAQNPILDIIPPVARQTTFTCSISTQFAIDSLILTIDSQTMDDMPCTPTHGLPTSFDVPFILSIELSDFISNQYTYIPGNDLSWESILSYQPCLISTLMMTLRGLIDNNTPYAYAFNPISNLSVEPLEWIVEPHWSIGHADQSSFHPTFEKPHIPAIYYGAAESIALDYNIPIVFASPMDGPLSLVVTVEHLPSGSKCDPIEVVSRTIKPLPQSHPLYPIYSETRIFIPLDLIRACIPKILVLNPTTNDYIDTTYNIDRLSFNINIFNDQLPNPYAIYNNLQRVSHNVAYWRLNGIKYGIKEWSLSNKYTKQLKLSSDPIFNPYYTFPIVGNQVTITTVQEEDFDKSVQCNIYAIFINESSPLTYTASPLVMLAPDHFRIPLQGSSQKKTSIIDLNSELYHLLTSANNHMFSSIRRITISNQPNSIGFLPSQLMTMEMTCSGTKAINEAEIGELVYFMSGPRPGYSHYSYQASTRVNFEQTLSFSYIQAVHDKRMITLTLHGIKLPNNLKFYINLTISGICHLSTGQSFPVNSYPLRAAQDQQYTSKVEYWDTLEILTITYISLLSSLTDYLTTEGHIVKRLNDPIYILFVSNPVFTVEGINGSEKRSTIASDHICSDNWEGPQCQQHLICQPIHETLGQCNGNGWVRIIQSAQHHDCDDHGSVPCEVEEDPVDPVTPIPNIPEPMLQDCETKCTCNTGWYGEFCSLAETCDLALESLTCDTNQIKRSVIDDDTGYCEAVCMCNVETSSCNGHGSNPITASGSCDTSQCNCLDGYYGDQCQHNTKCNDNSLIVDHCNNHGAIEYDPDSDTCSHECTCDQDWTGPTCIQSTKCEQKAQQLSCGPGGYVSQEINTLNCASSCNCFNLWAGTYCTQCPIKCYLGSYNPSIYCRDDIQASSPCSCETYAYGRYCQYSSSGITITVSQRSFPQWLVDSIIAKKPINEQTIKFQQSIIDVFNELLEIPYEANNIDDRNRLTNTVDKGLDKIYMNDYIDRTIVPISNMSIGYTNCPTSRDDTTPRQSVPSKLSFFITSRVGNSIAQLSRDRSQLYSKWVKLSTGTFPSPPEEEDSGSSSSVRPILSTILNNILLSNNINRLGDDHNTQYCVYNDNGDDIDYIVEDVTHDDDDDDDTTPLEEQSSNKAIIFNNYHSVFVACSIFMAILIYVS